MDEDDWEELDENAMEECMVLATQLCTQQPESHDAHAGHNSTHTLKLSPSKNCHELEDRKARGIISNGSLHNVRDSGVWSTRSSSVNQSVNDVTNSTGNKKRDISNNNYKSRFTDFSVKGTNFHPNTSTRKLSSSSAKSAVVLNTPVSRSSPSKVKSPAKVWPGSDAGAGNHLLVKKAEEEKAKLDERILVMQGEISLLRSELKRKETALETERLDHCAAIEAAERKGREKIAKQAAEADTNLNEKNVQVDKLQGELHFKKREIEELLQRCHRLELQPPSSPTTGPPKKRPRTDKTSVKDTNTSISSRFDFSCRPTKVCVEVQTDSPQLRSNQRKRLDVASPRGQISPTRSIATLLSHGDVAAHQHTPSASTHTLTSSSESCGSPAWSLPSEWLSIISGALKEDKIVEGKLVAVAVERLQQTHVAVSDGDNCRFMEHSNDPTEWYEGQVGPAIQIFMNLKPSSELSVLQAIIPHLSPIKVKDVTVNRRMQFKLLQAIEKISRTRKLHKEGQIGETLVSALRECCASIENGEEAVTLLRAAATLAPHYQLCVSSDVCFVSQLCKKVKKLCIPEVGTLRALLDWIYTIVKTIPPSLWLNSKCPCSSHLLGTFIWHIYQAVEAALLTDEKRKVYDVLGCCIEVLHHWSTIDPDWWGKVSPFPQYPALMATLATNANNMKFDRDTVELLCDLYEFEGGAFRR